MILLYLEKVEEHEVLLLVKQFGTLAVHEEENPNHFFNHIGVLDVFDHCLTEQEASELLTSFEEHNLEYEKNFIDFFQLVYRANNTTQTIYVDVRFPFEDGSPYKKAVIKTILKRLNDSETLIFRELLSYKSTLYKINDFNTLAFVVMLSTRELCFSNFYFSNLEAVFLGNYDLSFPLYCKDNENFEKFKKFAHKAGLHIRE